MSKERLITDDLHLLLDVLPPRVEQLLKGHTELENLLEVILDLGREPEARFQGFYEPIGEEPVSADDIEYTVSRVGTFGDDNRAGIERTLHRISALRNRVGTIVGLTCRVGRAVYGTVDIIRDVVTAGSSILIVGRPGVGKTTKLREVARVLADDQQRRVIVVDTSNEIAGDGDIPHPGIGRARRMQVPRVVDQHAVMIEAVENHMPEVVVIDEIGNEQEALAARTIAERGVQLIATCHGKTLDDLLRNPTLNDLIGGIHTVTLSDEEARRRGTQKTIQERELPPTFDVVVEMVEQDKLAVHHDIATVVDRVLRGIAPTPELRFRDQEGEVQCVSSAEMPQVEEEYEAEWLTGVGEVATQRPPAHLPTDRHLYIFPYGVSRNKLERAIAELGLRMVPARHMEDADVIIAVKGQERRAPVHLEEAARSGVPVHIIRANTFQQIVSALHEMSRLDRMDSEMEALREARTAIKEVLATSRPMELTPRSAYLRRLQHKLANQYNLTSSSTGTEPNRRVRIMK